MPDDASFYHLLAEYYDVLFPVTEQQRHFFVSLVKEHGVSRVLDVACGSGGQAAMFRDLGVEVSALENDARMVELVRAKGRNIEVRLGSMEDVARLFDPGFDMAICIGNSLPHLPDLDAVRQTVRAMRALLRPAGVLVLSIVNFDRVRRERITSLPVKKLRDPQGSAVTFERFYDLSPLPQRVTFSMRLTVDDKEHAAILPLTPISPEWLAGAVSDAGMTVLGRFADFQRVPFTGNAMSLVLVARAR